MWFVLLGIALVIVTIGGLYFRRRVLLSLEVFGVSRRARKVTGIAIMWLIFGVPVLTFVVVAASLALGRDSFRIGPTGIAEWLIVYPFWLAILAMLQAVPFIVLSDLISMAVKKRFPLSSINRARALVCLGATAVFVIYTPLRIVLERGILEVNHYQVGAIEGDPEPLRIAFFADLQVDHHTNGARAGEVVEIINGKKPDLILAGGDWINTGPDYIEDAADAGGRLRARLGVSSVRGDHEHFAFRDQERSVEAVTDALAKRGVEMIDNQVRFIEHHGKRIAIAYLSYNYIYRTPKAQIQTLIAEAATADYSILLTHQFDNKLAALVKDNVDLALVAHTHGGQVNPVVGFTHVSIARVETPYIAGRYQLGETTLIVTSGIGFSIAPFRYAAPASIEIIDVHL